ncbi:MAG: hypothetical protein CMP20_09425 [Rickettsiales bacterium]|nr:hypothetical protein [Rickettsiales bacterium]
MRTSVRHTALIFGKRKPGQTAAESSKRRKACKKAKRNSIRVQPGLKATDTYVEYHGIPCKGIHKQLHDAFWPNFTGFKAKRKSQLGVTKSIGLRTEAQIEAWLDARKKGRKPQKPKLKYARLFCAWVRANSYEIVACQHPIYDPKSGIATRIDFVLWDGEQYLLIELKVGYNYKFNRTKGKMTNLSEIGCSSRNQCHFQLAWMHHVVVTQRLFGDVNVKPLLVVLTEKIVKTAGVGNKSVEMLAKHLRKTKPTIAQELPVGIQQVKPRIYAIIAALYGSEPEVIDLT